jgi:hypothetical protein
MSRGRVWKVYVDDAGRPWAKRVDADLALQSARGWGDTGPGPDFLPVSDLVPLPRGVRPRYVSGFSALTGREGTAIVAGLDAELWLGLVTQFDVEATDGTIDTMTVVRKYQEVFPQPH